MPPRKVRKFKIGDVVRVRGDKKLARVKKLWPAGVLGINAAVVLDRKIKGGDSWNARFLVLVRARPVSGQNKKGAPASNASRELAKRPRSR